MSTPPGHLPASMTGGHLAAWNKDLSPTRAPPNNLLQSKAQADANEAAVSSVSSSVGPQGPSPGEKKLGSKARRNQERFRVHPSRPPSRFHDWGVFAGMEQRFFAYQGPQNNRMPILPKMSSSLKPKLTQTRQL